MTLVLKFSTPKLVLDVLVAPRASKERVLGAHDGALKIALTAPPVDGEANAALVSFIARRLGVAKRDVRILRGQQSKRKTLEITGATEQSVAALEASANEARSTGD